MNLNLSPLQQYSLESIGIDLWQLRQQAEVVENTERCIDPQVDQDAPHLIAQLELALNYCQQHSDKSIDWVIKEQDSAITLVGEQLQLPPLQQIFSNTQLKRQLWSVLGGH